MSESILTSHEIEHFTIDSQHAGFTYDVYLGGMPSAIPTDGPLPLLVVLDAYLMGLTAIETARLMGAVGEIEPFVIAAVSPAGGFEIGNTRRLRDFSAACEAPEDEPMFQNLLPRMKELGIEPKDAVGGSDDFRRFLVDEDLGNYMEIQKWIRGLGYPESGKDITNLQLLGPGDIGGRYDREGLNI